MSFSKKARTAAISKSIETGVRFPISYIDSRKYIQHNVNLRDGLGAILEFMDSLPPDNTKVDVRRSIEDGEYSVCHVDYVLGNWGPMVGFEIHRWEDDRIVEHWDNLQSTPISPNPSGRSMMDGATEVEDLHLSAKNKDLIERFVSDVLVGGNLDALEGYFNDSSLIQHNPSYGDGVWILRRELEQWQQSSAQSYSQIHKVIGEGNMVLVLSEGQLGGEPTAFYDLFRVSQGKIAEHWDVVETIPPRKAWQNDNGKF
jgi:predicted SnoaL-like aldol condensation-catalyzing enzyme